VGTPFEADDTQRLRDLRDAIAAAGDELSLPQLLALLTIAAEPNLSVNDLAERMGCLGATSLHPAPAPRSR
jgi:DNA-binding MarR family transcriptional regulator